MSIFVLRHEERGLDSTYFSSLTLKGKQNSVNLVEKLERLKIDVIYCSPFLRTIQTIYPYAIRNNKQINLETALYESIHTNSFNKDSYIHSYKELLDENPGFTDIINENYRSYIDINKLQFPENNLNDLYKRIKPFIQWINENHKHDNVLLVTHMSPIIAIKNIIKKNDNMDLSLINEPWGGPEFAMGHVECIKID